MVGKKQPPAMQGAKNFMVFSRTFFTFVGQQELLILIEGDFVLIVWYHYVPAGLVADIVSQCL